MLSLSGLEIVAVRAAAIWRFELLCSFTENRLWDKNDVPSWEPLVKPLTSSRAGKGSWARADFVCSDYQRLRNIRKLGELLTNRGTSVGFRGPHATTPSFSSTRVSCKPFFTPTPPFASNYFSVSNLRAHIFPKTQEAANKNEHYFSRSHFLIGWILQPILSSHFMISRANTPTKKGKKEHETLYPKFASFLHFCLLPLVSLERCWQWSSHVIHSKT